MGGSFGGFSSLRETSLRGLVVKRFMRGKINFQFRFRVSRSSARPFVLASISFFPLVHFSIKKREKRVSLRRHVSKARRVRMVFGNTGEMIDYRSLIDPKSGWRLSSCLQPLLSRLLVSVCAYPTTNTEPDFHDFGTAETRARERPGKSRADTNGGTMAGDRASKSLFLA